MKVIRQLLFAWMLVTFLVLEGFGQDAKPPPPPPPKPLPLPTKIITKSVSDENSSGNDDKLKLTTIKQRRTIKIPPRKPVPVLDWSDFTYNSPEEKAFWDKLPDWSDKTLVSLVPALTRPGTSFKRNVLGEAIRGNSSEGYDGYVKKNRLGGYRTVYQFVNGYAIRSKTWSKDGQKESEINYEKGLQDGLSTSWYENGQKQSETNYKNGKKDGLLTSWYENGQKEREGNYKDGKRMSTERWKPNGEKCPETNFKDGNGVVVVYYENGQKRYDTNYKDGKREGLSTWWLKDGQKQTESNYKDGQLDGPETTWEKNGQKKEERNYKDGILDGLSTKWYENGQKKLEENYKENKLIHAKVWLPDGKECPESKVIDGKGMLVTYSLEGKEISRLNFKDGIRRFKIPPPGRIPKRPLVLSEANSTTRPRYMPPRSQPPLKLPDRLRKRPASSEANSSKPTPPSLPPWLVPAAPK